VWSVWSVWSVDKNLAEPPPKRRPQAYYHLELFIAVTPRTVEEKYYPR